MPPTSPPIRVPLRRRRPALSCIECRRRKVKCPRTQPCQPCLALRIACTYKDVRLYHARTEEPASQLGVLLSSSNTPSSRPAVAATDDRITGDKSCGTPISSTISSTWMLQPELSRHQQDLERTVGDNVFRHQSPSPDTQHRTELKKTRLLRSSDLVGSLLGSAPEFLTIMTTFIKAGKLDRGVTLAASEADHVLHEIGSLLAQCKHLSRQLKGDRPSRTTVLVGRHTDWPPWDVADKLVDNYFSCFETTYRILHEPGFRREYAGFKAGVSSIPHRQQLTVLLVIAIGSTIDSDGHLPRTTIYQWVHDAETWLAGPLEKDRLSIAGIQVHCLTLLARQMYSIGTDLSWISTGALLQKAMQIGLHRDPKHLPPMSRYFAEMRRRLWLTILEMMVQDSLDASMPVRVALDEFDTELPSALPDSELSMIEASMPVTSTSNESDTALPTALSDSEPNVTDKPSQKGPESAPEQQACMQLLLARSLPLRLRIVAVLTNLKTELSYQETLTLTEQLLSECQQLATVSSLSTTQLHLLEFHTRRFIIPLNALFASKARSNQLYHYSLTIATETALHLMTLEADAQFQRLFTLAGGMFRETLRYASTIISLQFLSDTRSHLLNRSLQQNASRREPWKQALRDMVTLTRARVQAGATNVKNYMFLTMILAEAESIETGGDVEKAVRIAAKESLQECRDMIMQWLDGSSSQPAEEEPMENDFLVPDWSWDLHDGLFLSGISFD